MRLTIPALVLAAVLLAGCGGSSSAPSNGEASKSGTGVLADARKAATSASSLRVSGDIKSGGTPLSLDLSLAKGKGARGSMKESGLEFDLIRIGDTVYIRGSDAFLQHFAGSAASLLKGKWLKASATTGQLASLTPLTSPTALFGAIGSGHGTLKNEGETTYNGQKAVEILDTGDNSKLYVAATGKPYPIAIVGGGKRGNSGALTFGRWNAPVSLSAPKGALDFSKLGG
jgi:hypothetical protein